MILTFVQEDLQIISIKYYMKTVFDEDDKIEKVLNSYFAFSIGAKI
jgi:hypothetical protein